MDVEIGLGKKARQAYGFDDIAIVPSRRTRDPDDVDIGWKLGDHLLELPAPRVRDGRRRLAAGRRQDREARRPRRPEPRGHLLPLREGGRPARADRQALAGRGDRGHAGDLRAAGRARPHGPARARGEGRRRARGRRPHAAAGARVLADRPGGRARHPRHPGHRRLGGARVVERLGAQPEGVHLVARRARRRRRLRLVPRRAPPHADGRGGRSRRRRARAPRARRAASSASASRRRPRSRTRRRPGRSTCWTRPAT